MKYSFLTIAIEATPATQLRVAGPKWRCLSRVVHGVCWQIVDALAHLHGVEQVVHMNLNPQSVVVTKRGMWKLAGFAFAVSCSKDQQTVRIAGFLSAHSEKKLWKMGDNKTWVATTKQRTDAVTYTQTYGTVNIVYTKYKSVITHSYSLTHTSADHHTPSSNCQLLMRNDTG